jgi:hypothetical protein
MRADHASRGGLSGSEPDDNVPYIVELRCAGRSERKHPAKAIIAMTHDAARRPQAIVAPNDFDLPELQITGWACFRINKRTVCPVRDLFTTRAPAMTVARYLR